MRPVGEAFNVGKLRVHGSMLGKDGTRSRLKKDVSHALLWLALLTKAGDLLTAERIHRGLLSPDFADEPVRLPAAA
jgi:hypothetical protein